MSDHSKLGCCCVVRWFTRDFVERSLTIHWAVSKSHFLKEERKKNPLKMRLIPRPIFLLLLGLFALGGCGGPPFVVPPELEEQLDREATFAKLSESPEAYKGHIVMLTGMVLNIDILPNNHHLQNNPLYIHVYRRKSFPLDNHDCTNTPHQDRSLLDTIAASDIVCCFHKVSAWRRDHKQTG